MATYNTTWIATVPRTGSMWTANVVRQIFLESKFNVLPQQQVPGDEDRIKLFQTKALNDTDPANRYVLKVHTLLNPGIPRSKLITNIRNPYDVCASFYQFMKCDIDIAIGVALGLPKVINHYRQIDKDNLFVLRFEDIENEPSKVVSNLSNFLDVDLTQDQVQYICEKFTKEKIKSRITENDKSLSEKMVNKKGIKPTEIVILGKNNYRSFDAETGFQTGHISERNTGEWRLEFSDSDIEKIIHSIDDVAVSLGYASEKI